MSTLNTSLSTEQVSVRTGVMTGFALIAYFLLMRIFNLHYITELRYFNVIFLFAGIYFALHRLQKSAGKIYYPEGLGIGMLTAIISSVVLAVFMLLYLHVDHPFLLFVKHNSFMGEYMSPLSIVGVILIEGGSSGAVFTLMLMQYFKRFDKE